MFSVTMTSKWRGCWMIFMAALSTNMNSVSTSEGWSASKTLRHLATGATCYDWPCHYGEAGRWLAAAAYSNPKAADTLDLGARVYARIVYRLLPSLRSGPAGVRSKGLHRQLAPKSAPSARSGAQRGAVRQQAKVVTGRRLAPVPATYPSPFSGASLALGGVVQALV